MRPAQWDHSWGVLSDGHVLCRSGGSTQGVASFATAARLTEHHDQQLADLTGELNSLFMRHLEHPNGDGRELAILLTPDGWFLAWTRNEHHLSWEDEELRGGNGVVTLDSEDDVIRDALGLA
jgi:hypothetical protein